MVEYVNPNYPVPAYRYRVYFRGSDGESELLCSGVSGLELGVETIEYKDGLGNWFQMPGQSQAVNVTLQRGVLRKDGPLYPWLMSVSENAVDKRDLTISLSDESGATPLVTWNISDAFPVKLTAPSFDSSSNEVAIEEVSLLALRVTRGVGSAAALTHQQLLGAIGREAEYVADKQAGQASKALEELARAYALTRRIEISKENTTIIDGAGEAITIEAR
ncbi:phage tail protein [Nocardia sp. NPDC060256]|uniref:phage tail protein n=1 Tax=unclassified Nocardia TaxID=2637762 RepID=UPI003663F74E